MRVCLLVLEFLCQSFNYAQIGLELHAGLGKHFLGHWLRVIDLKGSRVVSGINLLDSYIEVVGKTSCINEAIHKEEDVYLFAALTSTTYLPKPSELP